MLQFRHVHRNFVPNSRFGGERAGSAFDRTYEGNRSPRIRTHIVFDFSSPGLECISDLSIIIGRGISGFPSPTSQHGLPSA
jgi:hypothetical protein